MLICLPILAFLIRQLQTGAYWQGAAITDSQVEDGTAVDEGFSFDPEADKSVEVGHTFIQKVKDVEKSMTAGDFSDAFDKISELSKMNLRPAEEKLLSELKVSYPERKDADYTAAVERSQTYLTQQKFELARQVMEDVRLRYKAGEEVDEAAQMIQRISEIEANFEKETKEKLDNQVRSLAKDRLLINRIERMHEKGMKVPVLELPALNRSLEVARLELITKPAHYLLDCYILMNEAEGELYKQLNGLAGQTRQDVFDVMEVQVPGLVQSEVYDISNTGIEYRNSSGGGNFKFQNIPPDRLYEIFKKSSAVDANKAHYYLYIYCMKYKLKKQAEEEKKKIASPELLQSADSLRDMQVAKNDLFSGSN